MSLIEKKSLYDRNAKGDLGSNVGTSNPTQGNYYTQYGQSIDSPFMSKDGPIQDLHKTLMENDVTSKNTRVTYFASKQDLNTSADPTTYSGQLPNPSKGQFGGPYKNVGPTDGFY